MAAKPPTPRFLLASMAVWLAAFVTLFTMFLLCVCGMFLLGDPLVLFMCSYAFLGLFVVSLRIFTMWEANQMSLTDGPRASQTENQRPISDERLRDGADMKIVVAGSRNMPDAAEKVDSALRMSGWYYRVNVIVSGGSGNVDLAGEVWGREHGCVVRRFSADWGKHGKAAGPIRNRQMAEYSDALVAVWDGESKGTTNMILEMHRLNKPVFIWNPNDPCVNGG